MLTCVVTSSPCQQPAILCITCRWLAAQTPIHASGCREFTLNMISEWFVEAANHTCGNYDPEVDEVALAGFTTVPSERVSCGITAGPHACPIHRGSPKCLTNQPDNRLPCMHKTQRAVLCVRPLGMAARWCSLSGPALNRWKDSRLKLALVGCKQQVPRAMILLCRSSRPDCKRAWSRWSAGCATLTTSKTGDWF